MLEKQRRRNLERDVLMDSAKTFQVMSDMVALLFSEIFENANGGHHKLATTHGMDVSSFRFAVRPSDGFIYFEDADISPEELKAVVVRAIIDQEYATLSLMSILPTGITEVRGWLIEPDEIKPVSPEDLITACATDFSTGNIKTPDPNTRYCDAWN